MNSVAITRGEQSDGTVGGTTVGVAPAANIFGVKVLSDSGSGSFSDILAAMSWVADEAEERGNPTVLSLSLGGGFSSTTNAAVNDLVDDGIVVVVAAGSATSGESRSSTSAERSHGSEPSRCRRSRTPPCAGTSRAPHR